MNVRDVKRVEMGDDDLDAGDVAVIEPVTVDELDGLPVIELHAVALVVVV